MFGAAVREGGRPSPALLRRTDHALTLLRAGEVARLFLTGGIVRYPPSEASLMRDRLVAAGVPENLLLLDEAAINTWTNARYAAAWWRANGQPPVVAISDAAHLPRCRLSLWAHGVPSTGSAPHDGNLLALAYEFPALVSYVARTLWYRRRD